MKVIKTYPICIFDSTAVKKLIVCGIDNVCFIVWNWNALLI